MTWKNITSKKIFVPCSVLQVAKKLLSECGNNEFLLALKGEWKEDGFFLLEEFFLPEQEVCTVEVDLKEEIPREVSIPHR